MRHARSPVKIGIAFPHDGIGTDPDDIADFAGAAEALGYSHIRVYDHVLGAVREGRTPALTGGPYDENSPFHETLVLLGFLAGRTTSLELATGVLVLPQRQTALVAKQAAEVDLLSRGRLRLGVGSGWNHVEYQSLNASFSDRGARLEEQVAVIRALWDEHVVDYSGRWHVIERAGILPRPLRQIPIWFGGFAPVARARAVRLGDGFMFGGALADAVGELPRLCADLDEAGRSGDDFGIDVLVKADAGAHRWRADHDTCIELGATHVTVSHSGIRYRSPMERIEAMAAYIEAVR